MNAFHGQPGNKRWKRALDAVAASNGADGDLCTLRTLATELAKHLEQVHQSLDATQTSMRSQNLSLQDATGDVAVKLDRVSEQVEAVMDAVEQR